MAKKKKAIKEKPAVRVVACRMTPSDYPFVRHISKQLYEKPHAIKDLRDFLSRDGSRGEVAKLSDGMAMPYTNSSLASARSWTSE